MSFSGTYNNSFTITNAKKLAAKVATDLKRMQRFHGQPSENHISDLEEEITQLLKDGYLDTVTYGFQRNGDWIDPTVRYTAQDLANSSGDDDDPGRINPHANVEGASFHSYLVPSSAWYDLSLDERNNYEDNLPFKRTGAPEPGVDGYMSQDKTYTSGSKSLNRFTIKK
ncbi:hypothetical protein C8N46_108135 [Kordia periserrulae]|uniref:Bacterial HORMA domain-containing protein n=1 Tax=Kordia periserrulae TaxID=701523 RepID=A0A2T6BUU4_9FLAO|nr:hypothetical protein [Kordia periserrulae]PTX59822.1 hypothetical protein C8N46_108135 [Kordia periserrulae]